MILWLKRGTAVSSFIFFMPLAIGSDTLWVTILSALINLSWAISERFPTVVQCRLAPCLLMVNAFVSTHAVLHGGPAVWAILVSGTSLISWNAGLFCQRWFNAPFLTQYRYLRRIGGIFVTGTIMGMSALALQGHFTLPFCFAFALALGAGFCYLRLISAVSLREESET
jgi:hypothetical protein